MSALGRIARYFLDFTRKQADEGRGEGAWNWPSWKMMAFRSAQHGFFSLATLYESRNERESGDLERMM